MLTRLRVRNFKRFVDVDIELGRAVVLIGPNNSGKTTALQALALWEIGLRRWNEKREGKASPEKRPGVTINRRDLISIPVPDANLLWRDLHVRDVEQVLDEKTGKKKPKTDTVRIDLIVDGITNDKAWCCGLEFDYANDESFYCRPLRTGNGDKPQRMEVPREAAHVHVAYLPPMSGLAAMEPKWEPGRINVLIGEGQTAQVLRNLCFQIHSKTEAQSDWDALVVHAERLFGVGLLAPKYIAERGEITMAYRERTGTRLDLSSAGRGLQQALLLFAHLYANPRSVLLLDEPDAHLEILRQRQIYQRLTDVAYQQGSQVIAASHSEVLLNEAAGSGTVIAFVGRPHALNDGKTQILKALKEIGWEDYYLAELKGWVLYLEGSTDLAILRAFAARLDHPAAEILEDPFVHYVGNTPQAARNHFRGLRFAHEKLLGVAIYDRLEKKLDEAPELSELMWIRREIENYFCTVEVLAAYARHDLDDDLFGRAEAEQRERIMRGLIADLVPPVALRDPLHAWWGNKKLTDDLLDPLFKAYFEKLQLPIELRKSDYHMLASLTPKDQIDAEVAQKLDGIVAIASRAKRGDAE